MLQFIAFWVADVTKFRTAILRKPRHMEAASRGIIGSLVSQIIEPLSPTTVSCRGHEMFVENLHTYLKLSLIAPVNSTFEAHGLKVIESILRCRKLVEKTIQIFKLNGS